MTVAARVRPIRIRPDVLRTLRGAALGSLLFVLCGATPAAAARPSTPVCREGKPLASNFKAHLVSEQGALIGCVRGRRHSVLLAGGDPFSFGAWRDPQLAGNFAVFGSSNGVRCITDDVRVVNLRTRRVRDFPPGSARFSGGDDFDECGGLAGEATTALKLRSDGMVAFISEGGEVQRGSIVRRGDGHDCRSSDEFVHGCRHKVVTLQSDPKADPRSLGLTRSGLVTWTTNGNARSALMPWRRCRGCGGAGGS